MSGKPGASATGMDDGTAQSGVPGQSFVDFGFYDDAHGASSPIAVVNPVAGEPDSQILSDLASQLNGMGVPASFDPSTDTLSLDQLLTPDQTLLYESSDTGLDFSTAFSLVPEPSTAMLLCAAVAGAALRRRRHESKSLSADRANSPGPNNRTTQASGSLASCSRLSPEICSA